MNNLSFFQQPKNQRGGMILGVILGVLVGLAVALGVAMYVMKVPTAFSSKGLTRSAEQDAQEAKKNKDWDPNAPLSGKPAAKPDAKPDAAQVQPATPLPAVPPTLPPATAQPAAQVVAPTAAPVAAPATQPASNKPAPSANTNANANLESEYFVQVAAFTNEAEAQSMRGKLALAGFEGRIVEREQSGRTVYRVRTGPFNQGTAEKTKTSLEAAGFDTVLIRSQK